MRVLVVEDEVKLARNIAKVLKETISFVVDLSHDGEDGQHLALTESYDLIVLDLMLPKVDGLTILKKLRSQGKHVPVLILTAMDAPQDVINGLNTGSDDYLTKPFHVGELVARCQALVRRTYDRPDPVIRIGEVSLDTASRLVTVCGKPINLRPMEYRLLEYLALRAGQIVTKAEITEHLYSFHAETFSNTIEVFVSTLRRKLDLGAQPSLIYTVRGHGYRMGGVM